MTTCRPDLAYASVKLSQSNGCPHEHHYHGLRHALKYMYTTRNDGLYFWRTKPRLELKEGPLPMVHSNKSDLLLDNRREHDATTLHVYADSDWATCVKTRQSFGGVCMHLAGGTIAYKTKIQPTVAGSSTEAKFMAASDAGKMILFVRSILWDLVSLKKLLLCFTKIMMHVQQWPTLKNLPLALATLTLSIFLSAIG
jgi:hypothetical protein